jgi:ribokinase
MAQIVVVGSLNMDLVAVVSHVPAEGETLLGSKHFTAYGGKGANQAYAVAKLGGDVAMLGRVGSDAFGHQMCTNLQDVGCDVTGVRAIEGTSGIAMILVTESGQNSIVVVPGANHSYRPLELVADEPQLERAKFMMLQLETPVETVLLAARQAKRYGAQVILDPAPALPNLPAEIFRYVDILTPNEIEAAHLLRLPSHELGATEAAAMAGQLRALGPSTVVIKLGAKGCVLADETGVTHIPAAVVEAVDTTAAGDIFNAALVVARSEGASMREACEFAVRASAISVTRFGAQSSVPSRLEVEAPIKAFAG